MTDSGELLINRLFREGYSVKINIYTQLKMMPISLRLPFYWNLTINLWEAALTEPIWDLPITEDIPITYRFFWILTENKNVSSLLSHKN